MGIPPDPNIQCTCTEKWHLRVHSAFNCQWLSIKEFFIKIYFAINSSFAKQYGHMYMLINLHTKINNACTCSCTETVSVVLSICR